MISDKDAIAAAQELHRATCERMKVKPRETVGEIAFAEGAEDRGVVRRHGKLAGAYRVNDDRVIDLDGAELVKLRSRLTNRKVR